MLPSTVATGKFRSTYLNSVRGRKAVEAPFCVFQYILALTDICYCRAIGASVIVIAVYADVFALWWSLSAGALACVHHEACGGVLVCLFFYIGYGSSYIATASGIYFFEQSC